MSVIEMLLPHNKYAQKISNKKVGKILFHLNDLFMDACITIWFG